jgi:hypothetical protein
VPALHDALTGLDRNSLQRRAQRQEKVLRVVKMTSPAQIAMHLRAEERELHKLAMGAGTDGDKIAAIEAGLKVRAQMLDLIGWPKRPTAPVAKGGRPSLPIDLLPADIQDAAEVPPHPPNG